MEGVGEDSAGMGEEVVLAAEDWSHSVDFHRTEVQVLVPPETQGTPFVPAWLHGPQESALV